MTLDAGKHYRLPDGSTVEVLELDFFGATVRRLGKKHVAYETKSGELVEYNAVWKPFTISASSILEEV